MTPVHIYNPDANAVTETKLSSLLKEAGCTVVPASDEAKSLIVLVTKELHDDSELEPAVTDALNAGRCVVALWPSPPNTDTAPEVLKKFAQEISWKAGALAKASKCEAVEEDNPSGSGGYKMRYHDC